MQTATRFLGAIHEGKLIFSDPKLLVQKFQKLEGKEVYVSLTAKSKDRSNNQNRYYWGVVIKILSEELGFWEDEIHDTLKAMFLVDKTEKIPRVRSTARLTTAEFEDFIAKVRMWSSSKLNIFIPEPNEVPFNY